MLTAIQWIGLAIVIVMVVIYGVVVADYTMNKTAILQHRARAVAGELEKNQREGSNSDKRLD